MSHLETNISLEADYNHTQYNEIKLEKTHNFDGKLIALRVTLDALLCVVVSVTRVGIMISPSSSDHIYC